VIVQVTLNRLLGGLAAQLAGDYAATGARRVLLRVRGLKSEQADRNQICCPLARDTLTDNDENSIIEELETTDIDIRRRRALVSKLGEVGTNRCVDVLKAALRSADTRTEVRAVFALSHIASPDSFKALIDSITNTHGPAFIFAVRSLAESDPEAARPAFVRTLAERRAQLTDGEKEVLVWALSQSPHRSEIPVLAPLLGEGRRETRRMAAVALAQIRAPEADQALEEAASSLPWLRARQARRALRSKGGCPS